MNAEKVEQLIEDWFEELQEQDDDDLLEESLYTNDAWSEIDEKHYLDESITIPKLGEIKVIESYGGEGQGDQYYLILSIDIDGVTHYYKKHGFYASFVGGEYDGPFEEVHPVEKVITVFEKV